MKHVEAVEYIITELILYFHNHVLLGNIIGWTTDWFSNHINVVEVEQ